MYNQSIRFLFSHIYIIAIEFINERSHQYVQKGKQNIDMITERVYLCAQTVLKYSISYVTFLLPLSFCLLLLTKYCFFYLKRCCCLLHTLFFHCTLFLFFSSTRIQFYAISDCLTNVITGVLKAETNKVTHYTVFIIESYYQNK